ncbi:putative cell division protein [Selenomonas ruminantium subsp. lactilytica TAM6421]|uniref:Cell division protein FtsL n=1 Tax=Selenomonas ruminantium subsp. lactilytica (strain NBRC 103574 / TAM6421) TaxID=927704 RepID=I0GMY5_SELRL|nr:cell division protein FtsL [Selenomonas ruminantium]BAL82122.1 putative cell division protein [Selenomonas ruminantium subsp. lactilytica TAM6421]
MLARQEEYYEEEAHVLTPAEERTELRKAPKEPLFKTVLDTRLRTHGQLLFLTMTVLALLVTVGSGVSASRGYELVAIQQQADQLEQENERLKIEIAKLKSPERIKTIAKDQLGMEVPKHTYFSSEK